MMSNVHGSFEVVTSSSTVRYNHEGLGPPMLFKRCPRMPAASGSDKRQAKLSIVES